MPLVFELVTPVTVDPLGTPRTISCLALTGIKFTTTPDLAPLGSGELKVTLTDPDSGYQAECSYTDATVLEAWEEAFAATVVTTIFNKLVADKKLPAGSIVESTSTALEASAESATVDDAVTLTATVTPSTATGSVTFSNGSTALGTATLSSGTASLSTSFSTVGTESITAAYAGATGFASSTSSATSITIAAASTTSTSTSSTSSAS